MMRALNRRAFGLRGLLAQDSIQGRLAAYLGILGLLGLVLSVYAVFKLWQIDKLTEHVEARWLRGTWLLGEMAAAVPEIENGVSHSLIAQDPEERRHASDHTIAAINNLRWLKSTYAALLTLEEERQLFAAFDQRSETYIAAQARALAGFRAGVTSASGVHSTLDRISHDLEIAGDNLLAASLQSAEDDSERVDATVDFLIFTAASGMVFSLILGLWSVYLVRKRILGPLSSMTNALTELAAGNTALEVPFADRTDEVGALARAFDVFRKNAAALSAAHAAADAAQKRAQALARHDMLTGLPNRRVFAEDLERALPGAIAGEAACGVLLLDLDRFKPVNDIYGHSVGDAVLVEIANRLSQIVRRPDTVARLGGDEFAVICEFDPGADRLADAVVRLANRLIAACAQPIPVGDVTIEVGASIGIASCPHDGKETETLLRAADIAMYRAKREGRGSTFRFFESSMDEELRARAAMEADLRRAVSHAEIEPYYQPLMALSDRSLRGFEVLSRWNHPTKGLLPPAMFIALAEEIGLIGELTFQVLRHACLDAHEWPSHLMFAMNVSPPQFHDPMLPARLMAILTETGFSPKRLELEITETALVTDLDTVRTVMTALQNLGISISLDDFGTGYSSLYHLRELTLDKVKIDRSFVQSMKDDPESEKIVNAIMSLTKSLGLPTLAEGIEDAETLRRIIATGCEYGQGYYFGTPMPAAEAAAMAHEESSRMHPRFKIAV